MKRLYINICMLALTAVVANGQSLEREVTIDREIEPKARRVSRPDNILPSTLTPTAKASSLRQAEYTGGGTLNTSLTRLEPAAWADTFAVSPYSGYVSAGYFPASNLGVSAGFKLINEPNSHLGVFLEYNGESHHNYVPSTLIDQKSHQLSVARHLATVGFDAGHRLDAKNIIEGYFTYSYGTTKTPRPLLLMSESQSANLLDFNVAWHNTDAIPFNAALDIRYTGFGKNQILPCAVTDDIKVPGVNQAIAALTGDVTYSSFNVGVDARLSHVNHDARLYPYVLTLPEASATMHAVQYISKGSDTYGLFALKPTYNTKFSTLNIGLGLNLGLVGNYPGTKFHIAPAINITFVPDGILSAWLKATGGDRLNDLGELYHACPWMPTVYTYNPTYVPVEAEFGLNIAPMTGLKAKAFLGYAAANNAVMPRVTNGTVFYTPQNMRGGYFGIDVAYQNSNSLKAHLGAEVASHGKASRGYYLWTDGAKYQVTAGVSYSPIQPLTVGLDYTLRTSRRLFNLAVSDDNTFTPDGYMTLGNLADLSLNANWKFNSRLDIFANVYNLTCRRWLDIAGVGSQRLNGLVGVNYKF